MIFPENPNPEDIARESLKRLLHSIILDLGNAATILLLQQRLDLYQRLLEATLAVKQVEQVVKAGGQK